MDREIVRKWRGNWLAVEAVQREEAQSKTVAQRWKELHAIIRMAEELNIPFTKYSSPIEDEAVRQRWITLKDRA